MFQSSHARGLDWSLCGPPVTVLDQESISFLAQDAGLELTADKASFNEQAGRGVLIGNVEVLKEDQYLRAERVQYLQRQELIRARGGIIFNDSNLTVKGPLAELDLKDDSVEFWQAQYWYAPRHSRGQAKRIYRKSANVIELEEATYTTCNLGKEGWLISAGKVELDRESGDGTARNVLVRFQNIPLLYTPWLRFPIDDRRKSGFLPPGFGTSSNSGTEVIVPFYWNMAPNRDMVISPRFLSERGLQLKSEFRYLYPTNAGSLDLEYINDLKDNDDRYFVSFKDKSRLIPRLSTKIDYNRASDGHYFEDFGNSLTQTAITHLRQQADIRYHGSFWKLLTRVQGFQTIDRDIDPLNRPYDRLPQVLFTGRLHEQDFGLGTRLNAEWVRFSRDSGVIGDRLDTLVGFDWPYVKAGFFAKPSVAMRLTAYNLRNTDGNFEEIPSRGLPIVSFDSGLIFERKGGDGRTLQTLEPRLYYLYVPFRDQNGLPTFDTTQLDFTFSQLFRENRFAGGDRVGDANQLTLALTTRFVDALNGHESLSASVGQIYYFKDLNVTLPGEAPEIANSSGIVGELQMRIGDQWALRGTVVHDPHENDPQRASTTLHFADEDNRILNLGYNFRRDNLEQTDIAFSWPVGRRWHALGRWNFDLDSSRNLEILGGIEYQTCCWRARAVLRRFINKADGEFNNTFMLQLELKGLAKLGSSLDKLLEHGILGYRAD